MTPLASEKKRIRYDLTGPVELSCHNFQGHHVPPCLQVSRVLLFLLKHELIQSTGGQSQGAVPQQLRVIQTKPSRLPMHIVLAKRAVCYGQSLFTGLDYWSRPGLEHWTGLLN